MRIGIVGAGQLARLLILEGSRLGLSFQVFSERESNAVSELAPQTVGSFANSELVADFANNVDLVTAEFEHVPLKAYRQMAEIAPCFPAVPALMSCQDRLIEKQLFRSLNIPTAQFASIASPADLQAAEETLEYPVIIKKRTFGYDGKGQWKIENTEQGMKLLEDLPGEQFIAEELVPFDRELSIIGVFDKSGTAAFYPLTETRHDEGILDTSIAPAPDLDNGLCDLAASYLSKVAKELQYVGVLTLELFQVGDTLIANELAPRVHNSGHWTLNGAVTSQFENHLRAITGLSLGNTEARGIAVMKNIIGSYPDQAKVLADGAIHYYDYCKQPKPGRKIGHMTFVANSQDEAMQKLKTDVFAG